MARVRARVTPNSRVEGCSILDGVIQVAVKAPPVEGKANRRVEVVLAAALGIPKSHVVVVAGETAKVKTLEIAGFTGEEIRRRLRSV